MESRKKKRPAVLTIFFLRYHKKSKCDINLINANLKSPFPLYFHAMRSLGWINFCLRTDVPDVWIVFFFAFNQIIQIEFVFALKNMSLRLNDEKAENKGVEIRIKKNK